MKPYLNYLNNNINNNISEFKDFNGMINWVNNLKALNYEEERNELLNELKEKINFSFNNLKPWHHSLSKGCQICGEGEWSCLFISGICNAKCFFCPSRQDLDDQPSSQLKTFNSPDEYADYINYFKFKGVSLSGGEPLLDLKKTIQYIDTVRKKCSPDIYLWVYTNGLLGSKEAFKKLKSAGVNEVRFNLCASNYNLDLIEKASGIIENITVEIPAVPEDQEKLTSILPQLVDAGVTNLNLHNMRLTRYNATKLIGKNYTVAHGESPTIIESELTALTILKHASNENLKLGINYCNYPFKRNFQKSGYRRKVAEKILQPHQEITEKGYIRSISYPSKNGEIKYLKVEDLHKKPEKYNEVEIEYSSISLKDFDGNRSDSEMIEINGRKYGMIKTGSASKISISPKLFLKSLEMDSPNTFSLEELFKIHKFEIMDSSFQEYY